MVKRCAVIAFMAMVCLCGGVSLKAQPSGATGGIDLVILIDQSGSMWGHPTAHPGKNDPWEHRIGAAKHVVFRLMQHVADTSVVHRVSVVDFADEAAVAISNQAIRDDPRHPATTDRLRALMEASVTAKDWGNTNTAAALDAARDELRKMATSPPAARRRIVLLLTDGRPTDPRINNAVLRSRIRETAASLSRAGIEFWVVGLNDADNYWNAGEGVFWEDLTGKGRARLAESASAALPSIFQNIVDEWLGLRSVVVRGDQYDCPPYLRRIVFNVTFGRPRGDVRIVDPDGRVVPRTGGGPATSPGTFALYAVDDPKPGIFTIVRDPSRSDVVHVEEFSPTVERLEPRGEADAGVETPLVFLARTAAGTPLQAIPEYPIKPETTVFDPLGNRSDRTTSVDKAGRFSASWKPVKPGVYRIVLRGLVRRKDGTDYDIFASSGSSSPIVHVGNRKPYVLRIIAPEPIRGLRAVPWKQTTEVRFALVGPDGRKVDNLNGLVVDSDTWLSIQSLADAGAAPLGPVVPLRRDATGEFVATIPTAVQWRSGEGWWAPGKLQFRVYGQSGRFLGDRYLRSIELPPGLLDRRIAGDPLSVGPLDIRFVWWGWALLAALALAVLVCVAWILLARWIPAVLIRRQDRAARRTVKLKVYDEYQDPTGSNGQEFNVTGKRISELNLNLVADPPVLSQRFRFVRGVGDRRPQGMLTYRWKNSKTPHSARLSAGIPRSLEGPDSSRYVALLVEEVNE